MLRNRLDYSRHNRTDSRIILGFDIGGSHVSAMAATVARPFNGAQVSFNLNDKGSATYLFNQIEQVGHRVLSAVNSSSAVKGIAVAVPGPFDYANGVSWLQHKFPAWYGVNVRRHFATQFSLDAKDVVFLNERAALLGSIAYWILWRG